MSQLPSGSNKPRDALPTVQALHRLWLEVAKKSVWAPRYWWRRLWLWRHFRYQPWKSPASQLLPFQKLPIVSPVGKINHCEGCLEICCVGQRGQVLLCLEDIAVLQDIKRCELMVHLPQGSTAEGVRCELTWQVFPHLAQNAMGACEALSNQGKCGLYPYWPLSCARFPYALHLGAQDIFYSQRCQSFKIHPRYGEQVQIMADDAVRLYNERLKDWLLLTFASKALKELGLMRYLHWPLPR